MRVLKGKFASSVFQSCEEKTPKTRQLVSGPHCVNNWPYTIRLRQQLMYFDIYQNNTTTGCCLHTVQPLSLYVHPS
jgi:hypothetical protein